MDPAEILAFDGAAQLDMEESFPAVLLFAGDATEYACAGGHLRDNDLRAVPGGLLDDYDVAFRIRRAILATPPRLGSRFQWKRQGEAGWRPASAVMRIADPSRSAAYMIYGSNPGQ